MNFEEMNKIFHAKIEINRFFIDGKLYALSEQFYGATLVSIERSFLPKETIRFIGAIPWKVSHIYKVRGRVKNLIFNLEWEPTYEVYWQCAGLVAFSKSQFKQVLKDRVSESLTNSYDTSL